LVLSVDKDTYEQLGLEGKKSFFKKTPRYNIHIDLCAPHFVPGKRFYERVRWCLSERLSDVELLAFWSVDGKTKEVEFPSGAQSKLLKLNEASRLVKDIRVPILDGSVLHSLFTTGSAEQRTAQEKEKKEDEIKKEIQEMESQVQKMQLSTVKRKKGKKSAATSDEARAFLWDLFEYLGLVANSALRGLTSEQHPFLVLDRFYHHAKILHCEWRGLISCSFIENLLTETRKLVETKKVPWAALTITGFEDAPLSWGNSEHGADDSLPGGENDYTFVVLPDNQYWLFSAISKNDTHFS